MRPATDVAALLPGLEASAALGCRFVLAAGMDADEARMVENYGKLCAAAATFGLTVGMEFISWNPMRTLQDALRVHAKVGAANAGVLIDFLHLARTGGTAADVAAVAPPKIAYVQICDALASLAPGAELADEARTHRFYPGEGQLPLAELLAALPDGTSMTLEAPSANHRGQTLDARLEAAAIALREVLRTHPKRRCQKV
jgi:sugar phosphate isomerase/epimerase